MRLKALSIMLSGVLLAVTVTVGGLAGPQCLAAAPANAPVAAEPEVRGTGATAAEAAHGEKAEAPVDPVQAELNVGEFIVTILIFVGLFLVLRFTAWKPILAGLKNREEAIRESVEAAQRAKAEADRTTRDLEAKMAEVQQQAAVQLRQAKADAEKIADAIRAQAETESNALKERTLREIDAAKSQAVSAINTHAAELGTAVARKILQRNVTADDQQRLVEESLAELAKTN